MARLGSHAARSGRDAYNSASTTRAVAVARFAHARAAGDAAGASQQLLNKRCIPNIIYLHGCRTKRRRRFINYV